MGSDRDELVRSLGLITPARARPLGAHLTVRGLTPGPEPSRLASSCTIICAPAGKLSELVSAGFFIKW